MSAEVTPWIPWKGGECPVREGDRFYRKHRSGDVLGPMKAWHGNMRPVVWGHRGNDRDIIAYRVIDQEVSLATPPIEHGEGGQ